jgi:hypothetical protein
MPSARLRRNQPHSYLALVLPASRTENEKIIFCCLSYPVCGMLYDNPSRLIREWPTGERRDKVKETRMKTKFF